MSLQLNIETNSRKPLVRQIQDGLREQIASGQLAPGQRLPSMRKISTSTGVSLGTIKQAINTLTTEGLLGSKSRGGVFVIGSQPQQQDIVLVLPSLQLEQMARLVTGAQAGLVGMRYRLVIQAANTDFAGQMHLLQYLDKPFVAGVVICSPGLRSYAKAMAELVRTGTPCVQVARYIEEVPTDAVIGDGYDMGRQAFAHLLDRGHRQIGFIDTTSDERTAQNIRKGIMAALRKLGLTWAELPRISTNASELNALEPWTVGQQATQKLLEQFPGLTAVVGMNPHLALGALRAAQAVGRAVPADLSVLAMENDLMVFKMTEPPISVVDMPLEAMAERAVGRLCEVIQESADFGATPAPEVVQLSPQFFARHSVATISML